MTPRSASSDFIGNWMSQIAPGRRGHRPQDGEDEEAYLRKLEFASVELSLKNLMTFPFVQAAVEKGELAPARRLFRRRSGKLLVRNDKTGAFEPVG